MDHQRAARRVPGNRYGFRHTTRACPFPLALAAATVPRGVLASPGVREARTWSRPHVRSWARRANPLAVFP
jgi:hypothetical protein